MLILFYDKLLFIPTRILVIRSFLHTLYIVRIERLYLLRTNFF